MKSKLRTSLTGWVELLEAGEDCAEILEPSECLFDLIALLVGSAISLSEM